MIDFLTAESMTLSVITLISLVINGVTIYRWIADYRDRERINDQSFHMIRGLALASTRRANMTVRRIQALEKTEQPNEQAITALQDIYADAKSNIETLLAIAKALKPNEAGRLPYDGDALLTQSIIENQQLQLKQQELAQRLSTRGPSQKGDSDQDA